MQKTADYKKYFIESVNHHFPDRSEQIISDTENHYKATSADTSFAKTSNNPIDRRLDFTAYFLALIKTLDGQGESYETIRNTCLEIVIEYVKPRNKLHAFLKKLPAKLIRTWLARIAIKVFGKKISQNSNPGGFVANIITDKEETYGLGYGVDILECGICKLFQKHDYQKYSSILCEVDAMTAAMAGLKLIRTGTIALGAKKCDFRWIKADASAPV